MEQVEELVGFLEAPRSDVRKAAAENVLALTGSEGGVVMLHNAESKDVGKLLARLMGDAEAGEAATAALVNMSANERVCAALVESKAFWAALLELLGQLLRLEATAPVPSTVPMALKLLNNVTTNVAGAKRFLVGRLGPDHAGYDLRILTQAFIKRPTDLQDAGLVLTNMSRLEEGRDVLLNREQPYVRGIVSLLRSQDAAVRLAALRTLRNTCFKEEAHKFLLRKTLLVEHLMLMLLGPAGIPDEDDRDELPELVKAELRRAAEADEELELEQDETARRAIVDTLILLCSSRNGREALRDKNLYTVVKAYHAEETNEETNETVFKLVDLLLGDEEGASVEVGWESSDDEAPPAKTDEQEDPEEASVLFEVD